MKARFCRHLLFAVIAGLSVIMSGGCPDDSGEGEGEGEYSRDYRQDMREFVQAISAYAKAVNPAFIVIPQNGEALLTETGEPGGATAGAYIAAIDGQGREDLFYGYDEDDTLTPAGARDEMLGLLDLAEAQGVEVLATDYCTSQSHVDNSYNWNAARGYISIAAGRDLNAVPPYPAQPYNVNATNVAALGQAANFLYLIDPGNFGDAAAYLAALAATDYDLLIVDAFFDDAMLTPAQVASLKTKDNGGTRLVIAYMSIGEAETYRYYWQPGWQPGSPEWLESENPDWAGNYKVQYWDPDWQAVVFGSETAYLDRIIEAGFDGVYLDIIDAYEYFEENDR